MADKKKAYIVTQTNCWAGKVGERVELSDRDAAKLVNKIRPADEAAAVGRKGKAEKELAALKEATAADAAVLAWLDTQAAQDATLRGYMDAARAATMPPAPAASDAA